MTVAAILDTMRAVTSDFSETMVVMGDWIA
jgi:hypothetical protein